MKSKKQNNEINDSQELRRLGVLIEHLDGNVGLIAEQQGGIKKDIGSIKETLNSHTEMIGNLAVGLEIVKADVKIVKDDLEIVKKDVKTNKDDLSIVKKDVKENKNDLEIVKADVKTTKVDIEIIKSDIEFIKNSVKKKVDIDESAALEKRVLLLEKHR